MLNVSQNPARRPHRGRAQGVRTVRGGFRLNAGPFERIDNGIQGDTGVGDVESPITLFDVFAPLHISSIGVSGKRRLLPRRNSDSESKQVAGSIPASGPTLSIGQQL